MCKQWLSNFFGRKPKFARDPYGLKIQSTCYPDGNIVQQIKEQEKKKIAIVAWHDIFIGVWLYTNEKEYQLLRTHLLNRLSFDTTITLVEIGEPKDVVSLSSDGVVISLSGAKDEIVINNKESVREFNKILFGK